MKEIKETKFLLNEDRFSQLCKVGYIRYQTNTGSTDVTFYKVDIITLSKGEVVSKDFTDEVLQFKLVEQLTQENIREIIKRSPIFNELSNQI
jgi:hypothetical protein